MTEPTLASRLTRRFAVFSSDAGLTSSLQQALPVSWAMTPTSALAALGDFAAVLQYRFLLVDLDERAFSPLDVVVAVRRELMLNIVIVCFGGDAALRDAARLARADRFFDRSAAVEVMQQFCAQYDW